MCIRDSAKAVGWTFDSETLYTKGKMDDGFDIDYKMMDPQIKDTVWNSYSVDPMNSGSYVVQRLVEEANAGIDWVVMEGIAY
jgi:hypothetical protein